jgi:hypothetical protein
MPKVQATKAKTEKWDFIKLNKNVCIKVLELIALQYQKQTHRDRKS